MHRQKTKYKVEFKTDNETVAKALELAVKKGEEYGTQREANEVKRHILGLFPKVNVDVFSVSRVTRVRRLTRF